MNWAGFIVTYAVTWWMVLFMVLPFGVRVSEAPEGSNYASAPIRANIAKKCWITTAISLPVSSLLFWLFSSGAFSGLLS